MLLYIGSKLVKDLFTAKTASGKKHKAEEEFHKSIIEEKNANDS